MEKKTETLHIRIEPKLKKRIKSKAKKNRRSVAEYVAIEMTKAVENE